MNVQCRWQHTSGDDGQMSPWPPLWPHPCSDCLVAMIPVCVRWPSFCVFHQIMWIFLFLTRLTLTLKIRTRIFVFHLHIFILMTLFIMYLFPLHFYWFPSYGRCSWPVSVVILLLWNLSVGRSTHSTKTSQTGSISYWGRQSSHFTRMGLCEEEGISYFPVYETW